MSYHARIETVGDLVATQINKPEPGIYARCKLKRARTVLGQIMSLRTERPFCDPLHTQNDGCRMIEDRLAVPPLPPRT